MLKSDIIEKIKDVLVDEFEIEKEFITPEANLIETLKIDSLDLVDLVVVIEKNFGFKVKGEEMVNVKTFQDFYNYVFERIKTDD